MIVKVGIIDDELSCIENLKKLLEIYSENNPSVRFSVEQFLDGELFIKTYQPKYDLLFLDIQMPIFNGIDIAKKIRESDENVMLVFVTNMIKYALEGYNVQAYDFIVKPLSYDKFKIKLDNICNRLKHKLEDTSITVTSGSTTKRLSVNDITYVEVENHTLIIHLINGSYKIRGTISEIEKELKPYYFCRCNACYLVNLKHVKQLNGNNVIVDKESLCVSRSKKSEFLSQFSNYLGDNE